MKRILDLILPVFLFIGCTKSDDIIITYTVTFESNDGSFVESQTIEKGKSASEPIAPTKENEVFSYWMYKGEKYDFSTTISKDITLYALWGKNISSQSMYISEVLDFKPAPGQYSGKYNYSDKDLIIGNNSQFISLGSFGGYVTFKFDHRILNQENEDFAIIGNSFEGNSEPASVMVALDLNGNGIKDSDEPWYELAGSEYNVESTKKNISITYYKPKYDEESHLITYKTIVDGTESLGELDLTDIKGYHSETPYPIQFTSDDQISFENSTLIESNSVENNGVWNNPYYDWGYADNKGYINSELERADIFDISWAVDQNGKKVNLEHIDFIKVYTSTLQVCGWLGERSPEISGAIDLNIYKY